MKFRNTLLAALGVVALAQPALAYDPLPPRTWITHNRSPTPADDFTRGNFAPGSITNMHCTVHGAAVTSATVVAAAPLAPNALGEARQATANVVLNSGSLTLNAATASMSSTGLLTVTTITGTPIGLGSIVGSSTGLQGQWFVIALGTGTGGAGTYQTNYPGNTTGGAVASNANFSIGTAPSYSVNIGMNITDPGIGYNPAVPPALTLTATGTTLPAGCSALVSPLPGLWNMLGPDNRSTGDVWANMDNTAGQAGWVKLNQPRYITDAVVQAAGVTTAPVFSGGFMANSDAFTGNLIKAMVPGGTATVDLPQDSRRAASFGTLGTFLAAQNITSAQVQRVYNQDGSGKDAVAGFNMTAAAINTAGSGYAASTTFDGTVINTGCSPNFLPHVTVTTNSSGVPTSVTPLQVGICPPTANGVATPTNINVSGSTGTGLTINATFTQVGPTIAPQLSAGGIMQADFLANGALAQGTMAKPSLWLDNTIAVPTNNFTAIIHAGMNSSHITAYMGFGPVGSANALRLQDAAGILNFVYGNNSNQSMGVGNTSLTPQTVYASAGPAAQILCSNTGCGQNNIASAVTTALAGGVIGMSDNGSASTSPSGSWERFQGLVYYGRALSTAEATAAQAADAMQFNSVPQAISQLVHHGDSRTENSGASLNQGICQKEEKALNNPSLRVVCRGWFGQTIGAMVQNFAAQVGNVSIPYAPINTVLLDGSINDFGGDTVLQASQFMQTWINDMRLVSFGKVYVESIYPKFLNINLCQATATPGTGSGCTAQNNFLAFNNALITPGNFTNLDGVFDKYTLDQVNSTNSFIMAGASLTNAASTAGCPASGTATVIGGTLAPGGTPAVYNFTSTGGVIPTGGLTIATSVGQPNGVAGGPYLVHPGNPVSFSGTGCTTAPTANLAITYNTFQSFDGTHANDSGYSIQTGFEVAFVRNVLGIN